MSESDWDYEGFRVLKRKGQIRAVRGIVVVISAMITAIFEPGVIYYWIFLWIGTYCIAGAGFYALVKGVLLIRRANKMVPSLKFGHETQK
jgi:hypothetical protein